jgi:hypothetical protein
MSRVDNILNIDGDDFSWDLPANIERAFGIKLTDEEINSFETVGDMFTIVKGNLNTVERSDALPCFTAAAFYALRRAMAELDPPLEVGPKSSLKHLGAAKNLPEIWRKVEERSGLALPPLVISVTTAIGGLGTSFGPLAAWLWFHASLSSVLVAFLGFIASIAIGVLLTLALSHFTRRYIPYDLRTFGNLAEATAKLNIGTYATRFGAIRSRDVWSSLIYIVGQYGSLTTPINSETRFFPKKS